MMKQFLRITPIILFVTALGCGRSSMSQTDPELREILPNGATLLSYSHLPDNRVTILDHDLLIGVMDGDPEYIFGDVRGIEVGGDGTIYVLDYQASEIRAFDADGRFLRIVAAPGEGPGEISKANGMILVADTVLWIQDHGKMRMIGISPIGTELITVPMPVLSYGPIWNGTVDNSGKIWKPHSRSEAPRTYPPKEGLSVGRGRSYLISYDWRTEVQDSLYLGPSSDRSFVYRSNGSNTHYGIPFDPSVIIRVDPDGGFWRVETEAYRIARLDARGDTVLVVDVQVEPLAVTEEDRRSYVDALVERSPNRQGAAESIVALMPEYKPVIEDLGVDDLGRLWVKRSAEEGENPRYDIFERDGAYRGSVILNFNVVPYLPIRVRQNRIYALSQDSLGVPSVMRTGPLSFTDQ